MTKVKKPLKEHKAKSVEILFKEFCDGYSQAIHAMQDRSKNLLQHESALMDWLVENHKFDNQQDVQRISQHVKMFSEIVVGMNREKLLKERDENLENGRKSANKNRTHNARNKDAFIETAVADYLSKALTEGLDKTNKGIIAFLNNSALRRQLQKTNTAAYTDTSFNRAVMLAAAKWRKAQKQKVAK